MAKKVNSDNNLPQNFGGNINSVFPSLNDDNYSIEEEDDYPAPNDDPDDDPDESDNEGNQDENQDDNQGKESSKKGKKSSPFKLLLSMMVNPVEGWKNIRRARYTADDVATRCFYPLAAVAALSSFADLFYSATSNVSECLVNAVSIFVAFFFGNFLILILQKLYYPKTHKEEPDSKFGKEFVMYNLASLCIFLTAYQLLPMVGPILAFLPIWTIYLAVRGCRFFRFPEENHNLMITLNCVVIIGVPLAIYLFFDMIL